MTPIFDDDLAHLRGNAMAHDVALDDGQEPVPLFKFVGFVSTGLVGTVLATAGFKDLLEVGVTTDIHAPVGCG